MGKELETLKKLLEILDYYKDKAQRNFQTIRVFSELPNYIEEIETAFKDYENLKEENKLLIEDAESLYVNYYDTWCVCESLKENSDYAFMFVDGVYCLVDTKDNKFDVIDTYEINSKGVVDHGTQKKLKALEIILTKDIDVVAFKKLAFGRISLTDKEKKDYWNDIHDKKITMEEYELLKEIMYGKEN